MLRGEPWKSRWLGVAWGCLGGLPDTCLGGKPGGLWAWGAPPTDSNPGRDLGRGAGPRCGRQSRLWGAKPYMLPRCGDLGNSGWTQMDNKNNNKKQRHC